MHTAAASSFTKCEQINVRLPEAYLTTSVTRKVEHLQHLRASQISPRHFKIVATLALPTSLLACSNTDAGLLLCFLKIFRITRIVCSRRIVARILKLL